MKFKEGDRVKRIKGSKIKGSVISIYADTQYLVNEKGEREIIANIGDIKVRFDNAESSEFDCISPNNLQLTFDN